jgi:putative ABC transport system substrate-binding protein
MRRREFIAGVGAVAWPLAARAQQERRLPTIGFLGSATPASQSQWTAAFVQRLRELGWVEQRTVTIQYRWLEGHYERAVEIAAEFVRLKVDVIVTVSTPASIAVKQATSLIPIVFAASGDPIGAGLVASLSRPGGNITGLSQQQTDTAGKRLELLRKVVPGLSRLAILANPDNSAAALERDEVQATARTLGLEAAVFEIQRAEDIAPTFEAMRGRADALFVCIDGLVNTNRITINSLALDARLPTIHGVREHVEAGGLMSYGASFADLYRRAAELTDKILRGTKPADIPVEQPTKIELVINLKTAKALGLTIPETLLATADEVIQ